VLVQDGTLRVGDAIVTGIHHGRVRAMMNEHGEQIDDVPPASRWSARPRRRAFCWRRPERGRRRAGRRRFAEHRLKKQREKDLSKATSSPSRTSSPREEGLGKRSSR